MKLKTLDKDIIHFFQKIFAPFARFGLFVIFFYFGLLKVIGLSPASALVQNLFETSIHFMSFDVFLISFGIFEKLIGILFLVRGFERIVIPLLFIHMITTFLPLILLPSLTWQSMMVPTLEGQYIIKNLALIAAAVGIAAQLHPAKNIREMV